jgi:hypothetical protein
MTDQLPPRPTSASVAAALARACDSEPFLADRPVEQCWWGLQSIDTVSGWQLSFWWIRDELGPLHRAIDPAGLEWCHGCARWPDWSPRSVVLDPITHLLTDHQRQQLEARLRAARCWPPAPLPQGSVLPVLQLDEELLAS